MKAFEKLIPEIEGTLKHYARDVSRKSTIEYDDALQELMIAAWKSSQTFNKNKGSFNTYATWRIDRRHKTLITRDNEKQVYEDKEGNVIYYNFSSIHSEDGDIEIVDTRGEPEASFIRSEEQEKNSEIANRKLDEVETALEMTASSTAKKIDQYALHIFKHLRKEKQREDGLFIAKTFSDIAKKLDISPQRVSYIFNKKIRSVGIIMIKSTEEKKDIKVTGLRAKIEWIDEVAVKNDKSKSEAVQMLLAKYPEMSDNYAKTIIYTYMKDYHWKGKMCGRENNN